MIFQDKTYSISQMIDIHSHILPAVDDGARGMEESLELIEQAAAQGITGMFATPHFSRHQDVSALYEKLLILREAVQRRHPEFQIYPGQENYYREDLTEWLDQGKALTMAESLYVLVEFDPAAPYSKIMRGVRKLEEYGYWPILAHAERYLSLREHGFAELRSLGCGIQMNFESLDGRWFEKEVRWCRKQVSEGLVDFLGTDLHRRDFRPPHIEGALKWLTNHINPEDLEVMVHRNPVCIINKEKIHD